MKDGLCEVCLKKKGKYKCPGCKIRFCSTLCCKTHKKKTGCSGERKRSLTMKLSLTEYKEEHFQDDLNFLENTQSHISHLQWKRRRKGMDDHTYMNFHKESEKFVQRRARERGTLLSFMPVGMKLRKMNTTCYMNSEKRLYWRVHLVFYNHNNFTLENAKCSEDEKVEDLMIKSIQRGKWRQKDPFFEVFFKSGQEEEEEYVRIYLKIPKEIEGNEMFYKIDSSKTLKENLKGKSVLEFPIFHVVVGKLQQRFFSVSETKEKELYEYENSLIHKRKIRD